MIDMLKAELLRFRWWAATYALVHLALLAFYGRVVDLLQQPPMIFEAVAGIYALSGLLLGLYQMGGYRRANAWVNLLHRPIAPRAIALGLIGAGALLIAAAVALPTMLLVAVQDSASTRVVDARHWLLPLAAFLIALSGYLAGSYAILGVRRYAFLVLILPTLFAISEATGWGAIALQLLIDGWLMLLVLNAFKPDLSAPPSRPVEIVVTAIPVQVALYAALVGIGGIGFQLGWIMLGTHPLNSIPPSGGYVEASRAQGPDLIEAGLAASRDPQARLWREQVRISDSFRISATFDQLPVRGEMINSVPVEFSDEEKRTLWTFSHDAMRFVGRSLADGREVGTLGLGERDVPFPAPPLSLGEGTLIGGSSIAVRDSESGRISQRILLERGEAVASAPIPVGESIALMSDRTLYFYDALVLDQGDRVFPARAEVSLPGKVGNVERIDLIELLDGYLVSFTFGRGSPDGAGVAYQRIVRVDEAGRAATVAERSLGSDFPPLLRFLDWWLSPVLDRATDAATQLFAPPLPLRAITAAPLPTSVWALALALLGGSLIAAWWWSARVALRPAERVGWTLAAGFVGLPALISLMLFHPRRRTA